MQGLSGAPTNFPFGFAAGTNVRGFPVLNSYPGQVIWVSNSTTNLGPCVGGQDGNPGTWQRPMATLAGAVSNATSSVETIIAVKPGHSETISSSTALTMSVSGCQVLGFGVGNQRPLFTLDTAATATVNVTADGCGFSNCRFVGNFANITSLFTLTTAKSLMIDSCSISDTASNLNFLAIVTVATTSNAADGLIMTNNRMFASATSGAVKLVDALGTNAGWLIAGNVYTAVTTGTGAMIPIAAGKILTNFLLDSNNISLQQTQATATGILITTNGTTNTGWISRNLIQALDDTSEILVTASSGFLFSQNYYSGVADKSGYLLPAADS